MRGRLMTAVVASLAVLAGCNSKPQAGSDQPPAADLVLHNKNAPAQVLLKETFVIQKNKAFRFEVPAHSLHPIIHGTFQSSVTSAAGSDGDQNAEVELMLMDDGQYRQFLKGSLQETLNTITPSANAEVNWRLSSTIDDPAVYYFVFLNPRKGPGITVTTDFILNFE